MKKKCQQCGAEFEPKDHSERARFCGPRCSGLHCGQVRQQQILAERPPFVCKTCGVEFRNKEGPAHTRKNPPKYCSLACRDRARTTRVLLVCRQCGVSFERKAYMAEWSHHRGPFCSTECYGHWQRGKANEAAQSPGKTGPAWERARRAALDRDGSCCVLCGGDTHVEVHHKTPWKLGDPHLVENLETRCRACHHTVHQKHGRRARSRA
ncbi:MAG: HNH endonuclease [Chloroflexi bacterium]|nr:HNH endonuclease [Chloroflexota bacterium]MBE3119738.1 HNH endonuclease [Candidatus Atribacteria bacterium]